MIDRSWVAFLRYHRETVQSILDLKGHSENPFYRPDSGDDEAVFYIPWSNDDSWLVKEFRKWLKYNRPEKPSHYRKLMRQRNPTVWREKKVGGASELKQLRADLKALGAVRLFDFRGQWQIAAEHLPNRFRDLRNRQGAWSEARKRVKDVLSQISVLPTDLENPH